jgi:hypothetical protein
MKAPSYRQRLEMLRDILETGQSLFSRMRQVEEQLQAQLIAGDHAAVSADEGLREELQRELAALEKKRRALLPAGMGMHRYITTFVGRSRQEDYLKKLEAVRAELQKLAALHEVNRTLLAERLRIAAELREKMAADRITYDRRGQLEEDRAGDAFNLDRNC